MSCGRAGNPQAFFEHARRTFQRGDLIHSQQEAQEGYRRFSRLNSEWAWKFKLLEAESLLWRGQYSEVLTLLDSENLSTAPTETVISIQTLRGIAHARQLDLATAKDEFDQAERLCNPPEAASCGEAFQGRGIFALGQNQFSEAQRYLELALSFAKARGDHFLETTSLVNLGGVLVQEGHFDEAIDRSNAAYLASTALEAGDDALAAQENLGWAYYRLGDSERALHLMLEAEKHAGQLGDVYDQENALTNIGYIYMDARSFDRAEQSFQRALDLATAEKSKAHILNALRVRARLALQTGDLANASQYAQRALEIAQESGNHADELYPTLVQGQLAARSGNVAQAESNFRAVERDPASPVFLKWEAQHALARLYQDEKQSNSADHEYRAALATFEGARDAVSHGELQLSFLANASRVYDDYIHFLVERGKTDEALRWADYSRARSLAEGLDSLTNGPSLGPPLLNPQQIARRAKGALLFYWMGEKQSFLWTITPQKTALFSLPPSSEIEAAVQRYRKAVTGPVNVLDSGDSDGRLLYDMLIAPAQSLLPKDSKVFIIPDGSLNNLNFETLLVPAPKLHYWIEDVSVADTSSLRVLDASHGVGQKHNRSLLLVGNSVAPNDKYPEVPKAAVQMESVAKHFPAQQEQVLTRGQATPQAYLGSNPDRFSYIHFVAHGTASRLSPLDSAIILSRGSAEDDSFKLYARDIIRHPLHAELVTISACNSAGDRSYAGEGLVGLSWAFIRAGARNVVAALWEVQDDSTAQFMDKFYDELNRGATPDVALRTAKLSLLRNSNFRSPFYWAPFQLYARIS